MRPLAALALLLALPAAAQELPDRRAVPHEDMDMAGGDLAQLFDTTLRACAAACAADPDCRAFTYNRASASCFPKDGGGAMTPFAGAVTVRMEPRAPAAEARAARARAELGLGQAEVDAARAQAEALPYAHPLRGRTAETLIPSARRAMDERAFRAAMAMLGEAITATGDGALWTDYAEAAAGLARTGGDGARARWRASRDAALNGYLRAPAAPERARALLAYAAAKEGLGEGRETLAPLRLARALSPGPETAAALERAAGRWGMRVEETTVESDAARPRICVRFSEDLRAGTDMTPFVGGLPQGAAVEAEGRRICIAGLTHGARYEVTLRAGIPAASGEALMAAVPIASYVRDRAPLVRFPGRGYVLPASADPALPVVTVNAAELDLTLYRLSDRNLVRAMQEDYFARPIEAWRVGRFEEELSAPIWEGTAETAAPLNDEVTTSLPLAEALGGQEPGLYALRAALPGEDPYDAAPATQWFVVSDIGIGTIEADDGIHVMVRALSDAGPMEGAALTLVSRSNEVLAEAVTDARGHARFEPSLAAGRGAAAPALVTARMGDDMAFLPLTGPAFDLSDRGAEGRAPAGPIDVFLATDRGAYRPGEAIHATSLARDARAAALPGLPLTTILTRPDGVEQARRVTDGARAGGHVASFDLSTSAPRGTWRIAVHADPEAPALASRAVLVEDFVPERIDLAAQMPGGPIDPAAPPLLKVQVDYLFGAPGADLPVEGEVIVRTARELPGWEGWVFGPHDARGESASAPLPRMTTDADGAAQAVLPLPDLPGSGPWEASVRLRASDGSRRPVERETSRTIAPLAPVIGLRPLFDGAVPQGTEAPFEIVRLGPDLAPSPAPLTWTVSKVVRRYQWYRSGGSWSWEAVTTRERVDGGEIAPGEPMRVSVPVDWGRHEIVVTDGDAAASEGFSAGWYAVSEAFDTPDRLDVALDRAAYAVGDTARLRIAPEAPGTALVAVVAGEVVDMRAVEVDAETVVDLPVTEAWGSGAYAVATLLRPSGAPGRGPARALGLAHAAVDPGAARLSVTLDAPEATRPRGPLTVGIETGSDTGADAWVTVAAVDVGVLNLTGFEAPDPAAHYFGQRGLGAEIRDIYGRLIDGSLGARGRIRSGGDGAAGLSMDGTPPTEDVLALFSGPVRAEGGRAEVTFDLPPFDGTVRLMAVAWSEGGVGSAEADVTVRDPVVLSARLPRFLAPGDEAEAALELRHADGAPGTVGVEVTLGDGLALLGAVPPEVTLAEGASAVLPLRLAAGWEGDPELRVALTLPSGEVLERAYRMPVRANDPEVTRTSRLTLAAGQTLTLTSDVFTGLRPGASATLALGEAARLDAAGLLRMLDRYPYRCSEQSASRAMPLLSMAPAARALGIETEETVKDAIARVLSNQASNGGFGLWRPASGEFWLDAYVTDFLTRARRAGYEVPETALTMALDNLQNRVNYAPDFEAADGTGADVAYALHVLAREGRARMGDLRYYADVKAADLGTPLAQAQLGAALALYGDTARSDRLFRRAAGAAAAAEAPERPVWRADYGTATRDVAGVLALASEAGTAAVDRTFLAARLAADPSPRSTQEAVWTLAAAAALGAEAEAVTLDGAALDGPSVRLLEEDALGGARLTNGGVDDVLVTVTAFGVPEVAPAPTGTGYAIARAHLDMEGRPIDISEVAAGTRIVTLLRVTPLQEGGARLMVTDPLPAGFEIDIPSVMVSGDAGALPWLTTDVRPEAAEFRTDRFLAAVDWRSDAPFELAYVARAVTPGAFRHPAASVEDMYRPRFRAVGETGEVVVTE